MTNKLVNAAVSRITIKYAYTMKNHSLKRFLAASCIIASTVVNLYAQLPAGTQANAQQSPKKTGSLAPLPPMGFNTWNTFQTHIDETMLRNMVDQMVASGMRDAGYQYFVLDDGWMSMERDANGQLTADPKKFPSGMKAFADYVHSKGLKFGIYNCAGTKTCAGYPGTHGHEYEDARLYASWGVDFLKYDWCATDSINARDAYKTMSLALQATGRPILFNLCEWGQHQPWLWAKGIGEMYRATGDIGATFTPVENTNGGWRPMSVLEILDKQLPIRQYNYPNHWNDMDMLEVGNGMTYNEDKAHFSLWCMMSAPLVAGNDLRKMTPQTAAILTNRAVIAVDQDSAGIAAFRYYSFDGMEIWVKPLSNGDIAVCFLNRSNHPQQINYEWAAHHMLDTTSHADFTFTGSPYHIKNLWTGKSEGFTGKAFKQLIPAHDVVMLRLSK